MATDCGGRNRAPQLTWSGVPAGVKSFAFIMHDPDAPIAGGFYHWVVYNLPATARALGPGAPPDADQFGVRRSANRATMAPARRRDPRITTC